MQKTNINVDEAGVEAAAATMLGLALSDNPVAELEITIDRPFMYIIMNEGVPMFIGTVYNPVE